MTVVKPTILKQAGSRAGSVYSGPSDKEIADLQVNKVALQNEIQILRNEFNSLSSQKVKIQKEISDEMALYNGMVLKTTAEMEAELAQLKSTKLDEAVKKTQVEISDRLKKHQLAVDNLQQVFTNIESRRIAKQKEIEYLEEQAVSQQTKITDIETKIGILSNEFSVKKIHSVKLDEEIQNLSLDHLKIKTQLDFNILESQKKLDSYQPLIDEAKKNLTHVLEQVNQALSQATLARQNAEDYKKSQQIHAEFLARKERDLKIWEDRLTPMFKEKYPDKEMKFI